jgi:hypothetical protein
MPIEIRELVIKATISQENTAAPQSSATAQSGNAGSSSEQIINTCIEKVLEILKSKNQR